MNILITGASGFLGGAIALRVLSSGYTVALLLRKKSSTKRLQGLDEKFLIGRCESDEEVKSFLIEFEPQIVIHTACSYGRNNETQLNIYDANFRFGMLVIESLLDIEHPITFINTGSVLASDVSLYALSKNQFSQWGMSRAKNSKNKLKFVDIQLQHMYGPGDDESKFVSYVFNACMANVNELKLTLGEQKRDFIYIDDVVTAYLFLIEKNDILDVFEVFDLGTGCSPTIKDFVEMIKVMTSSKTKLIFGALPYRKNEAMNCIANMEKFHELGFTPCIDISQGLNKMIEFCS